MAAASGSSRFRPWPDLPQELLGLVLARVASHADRVRLRAVCRPWRSGARQQHPLPPLLPWLVLPDGTFLSLPDGAIHRVPVPHDVCYRVSTGGALFLVQGDGTCSLTSPSPTAATSLPKPAFCDGCTVVAYTRGSGRPGTTMKWAPPTGSSVADIALFKGKLYVLTTAEELHVVDVHDEQTTAVPAGKTLRVSSIPRDDEEHSMPWNDKRHKLDNPYAYDNYVERWYLVVSGDQLLMVKRMINIPSIGMRVWGIEKRTRRFRVFEAADLLNDGHGQWREVTMLTGRALFVSQGCSESIPAEADAQCGVTAGAQADCIYFVTEDLNVYFIPKWIHEKPLPNPFLDSGVYHMRDETVTSLPSEKSTMSVERPWSATWIFPET
ncbi:unnamed protein product [Alopecurus aequalis]